MTKKELRDLIRSVITEYMGTGDMASTGLTSDDGNNIVSQRDGGGSFTSDAKERQFYLDRGAPYGGAEGNHYRKEIFMPLCCPECNKIMKHRFDKDNHRIHKKCFDCVIKFEHKLRNEKKYDRYIKNLKTNNNITALDEVESYLLDAINKSNNSYVSEDGVIERWVGGIDKIKMTKEVKEAAKLKRERLNKELND